MKLRWLKILVELPNIMSHIMEVCWWSVHSSWWVDEWSLFNRHSTGLWAWKDYKPSWVFLMALQWNLPWTLIFCS